MRKDIIDSKSVAKKNMKKYRKVIALLLCTLALLTACGTAKNETKENPTEYDILAKCEEQVRRITDFKPEVAIVLGTGLGELAEMVDMVAQINYADIEGLPISTVDGHAGKLVFGYINEVPVVVMKGRVHYYEGYTSAEVVRPIRLMNMLGAERIILTNSSGAINKDYSAGDIMMITDQILYNVPSPLIGEYEETFGDRFPDMGSVYTDAVQEEVRRAAEKCGICLKEGVYLQDSGPQYETKAEVAMFRQWGADAVGMSTAIEAIAARQLGMEVCGLSCVTCAPTDITDEWLSDEEVQKVAKSMNEAMEKILCEIIH